MKYAFIREHLVGSFPLVKCCKTLGVSRSGYYKRASAKVSKRETENIRLLSLVENIYKASRSTYGSPRIHAQLKAMGHHVGRGRIERLMRRSGIRSRLKRRFRITTDSRHGEKTAPNLLQRRFHVERPNKVWASDVTYLWTKSGWLYLAVTLDLCSRRVVGWSMAERLDKNLVLKCLAAAAQRRSNYQGVIHHSDRGKEYACAPFREALGCYGMRQSMSKKGDCWDNAVVESFFHTLKSELTDLHRVSRNNAKAVVFEWLEVFYDRRRLHSTLGYVTPAVYEANMQQVS